MQTLSLGLTNRTHYRKFEIKHDGICHCVKEPRPGYTRIEVPNPRTKENVVKYVQRYDSLTGLVLNAEWYAHEITGTKKMAVGYLLTFNVGEEIVHVDFPAKSTAFDVLMRCAPNIDWTQPLRIHAWLDRKTDPPKMAVFFSQAEHEGRPVAVKRHYTKDHPNGCPPAVQDEDGSCRRRTAQVCRPGQQLRIADCGLRILRAGKRLVPPP